MDKLLQVLMLALAHAPELIAEGESLFHAVADGRGGAQKVAHVASQLSQLAATASNVAAQVQASAAQQNGSSQ